MSKTIKSEEWHTSSIKMHKLAFITNILSIAIFVTIGHILDIYFGTKPILLLISVPVSFLTAQTIIIKKLRSHTKKLTKNN